MKKITMAITALVLSATVYAQTWNLDKAHAKLGFTVTHLMLNDVDGRFKSFDATVTATRPDFSDAVVQLSADVSSIFTDNEQRDKHLMAPDFFDAEKHPKLTFKSKTLKKTGSNRYKLIGDLTMHGVTKPVELDVQYRGTIEHPMMKKPVAGFKVTGVIKRSDFKIGETFPGAMISDEVEISANAEFLKG